MKTHIVGTAQNDMRIVPRLARVLADVNGWSLSLDVDPTADLNVFFPYLEHRTAPTKTAAWFTHKDSSLPGKIALWERVALTVNVRVASADRYARDVAHYGKTFTALAPIDHAMFHPSSEHAPRARPLVGTSGFVYKGGRKGEAFLGRLALTTTGKHCDWTAIGREWPVPTKSLAWRDVPDWYRSLDVYVCTSEIEGIGYGVLEALACGIPTVLPRGVGVFDELADAPGLCRYDVGDLDSAEMALTWALAMRWDERLASGLNAVVADRTDRRWGEDWRRAALAVLDSSTSPTSTQVSGLVSDRGVFIVAFGKPARSCAQRCLAALRRTNPGLPVAICSTDPLGGEDVFVAQPDVDIGGRLAKVSIQDLAPPEWRYVCYLDADTEPLADISPLFSWVADGWDMTICQNPTRYAVAANMKRPDNADECKETFRMWGTDQMMQWNGGVFAFARNERTRAFFTCWREEWKRHAKRDQGALLRALWQHPIKLWALTNCWNEVDRYQEPTQYTAIAHHPMTARRWDGIVDARSDSPTAWARVTR